MITPKPKTVVELFEGHPERWTKDKSYADKDNGYTTLDDPATCRFCIWGALYFVYGQNEGRLLCRKYPLDKWNDAPERTFEEVLSKCKELGI